MARVSPLFPSFLALSLGIVNIPAVTVSSWAQTTTTPPAQGTTTPPAQTSTKPPASTSVPVTSQPTPTPNTKAGESAKEASKQEPQATPTPSPSSPQQTEQAPAESAKSAKPEAAPIPDATDSSMDDFSIGEIPEIKMVELTPETARKALETYLLLKNKYKDAELENYESLTDFVEKDPSGKAFDADIKAAGFTTPTEWNDAITTLSVVYANITANQTAEIEQQIAEVEKDTEIAQDMRTKIITSLKAFIPSANNKKIVDEMIADPALLEKLKELETEQE